MQRCVPVWIACVPCLLPETPSPPPHAEPIAFVRAGLFVPESVALGFKLFAAQPVEVFSDDKHDEPLLGGLSIELSLLAAKRYAAALPASSETARVEDGCK